MRRLLVLVLAAAMLLGGRVRAEEPEMRIDIYGGEVLPGRAAIISMIVPEAGTCSIHVLDDAGREIAVITAGRSVSEGYNSMYWNGTWEGKAVPEGIWRLVMEMNGRIAETEVTVGRMIPCLIAPSLSDVQVTIGRNVRLTWCATEAGELNVSLRAGDEEAAAFHTAVESGDGELVFPASVPPGDYEAVVTLVRNDGTSSDPASFPLAVRTPEVAFSPASGSPYTGQDLTLNGWTVPMDITDEEAVWQALTAPVTVLDDGKSNAERRQAVIRKEPSADSEGIGVVTLVSQGVHVLERGGEWSLIECYSSSFHNSSVLNWNVLVQGYVPTRYLREVMPNQQMGLVVDKLTQRLYIFLDGSLFSMLLVSTGQFNAKQPYNETRAGEYLLVSKVGGFMSDNYYCPLAIRFNSGDLLHEVPYIQRNLDYSGTEPKLGYKASHGCIRVQRKANPDGVNMQWIWKHYQANTKILVWEDWQGRQISIPDDDTIVYCNLRRNTYYHSSVQCSELGTRTPQKMTYAQLSGEDGAKLKPCPYCGPMPKKGELQAVNEQYAAGGDHEPGMTEARRSCPRRLNRR